jgi:hypothetical protein
VFHVEPNMAAWRLPPGDYPPIDPRQLARVWSNSSKAGPDDRPINEIIVSKRLRNLREASVAELAESIAKLKD